MNLPSTDLDPLTALPTKRAALAVYEQALAACRGDGRPFASGG